jgi:hypothetical protein
MKLVTFYRKLFSNKKKGLLLWLKSYLHKQLLYIYIYIYIYVIQVLDRVYNVTFLAFDYYTVS